MTDEAARRAKETPLAPTDASGDEKRNEMAGEPAAGDQVAYRREAEVDDLGQMTTHVDPYEGELEAGVHDDLPQEDKAENLELLTERELRDLETGNPDVAAEEGMTYVPPMDPPVVPSDDRQGAEVAAGFGHTSMDEPFDRDHHATGLPQDDEMAARVREALRSDAATSRYADNVAIGTRGGTVALRGTVDDVEDTDSLLDVAGRVTGVEEVIDELEVRGL